VRGAAQLAHLALQVVDAGTEFGDPPGAHQEQDEQPHHRRGDDEEKEDAEESKEDFDHGARAGEPYEAATPPP
jgi:hypothetical protein